MQLRLLACCLLQVENPSLYFTKKEHMQMLPLILTLLLFVKSKFLGLVQLLLVQDLTMDLLGLWFRFLEEPIWEMHLVEL
jgi:hypothetical protein